MTAWTFASKNSPRRAEEALDGPFRGPERLALALPLTAALGLMIVVAVAAGGQSPLVVTGAAAGGFALCALAPLALLQAYVGRPLRLALAHLRAARDGVDPPPAAPAGGVIADLVAAARDIQAGQVHLDRSRGGLALCETMAAAGGRGDPRLPASVRGAGRDQRAGRSPVAPRGAGTPGRDRRSAQDFQSPSASGDARKRYRAHRADARLSRRGGGSGAKRRRKGSTSTPC